MKKRRLLKGHTASVLCCVTLDSSPSIVASGGEDGRVCVFDLRSSNRASQKYQSFQGLAVASLCFRPGSEDVFYAAAGSSLHCIDLRLGPSGTELASFQYNDDDINQVAVNRKATYLAACDDSGNTKIVDLENQRLHKTLRGGHTNICSSVQFHPQKTWEVVTGGLDCKLSKWDFSRGKLLCSIDVSTASTATEPQVCNPPFVHALACPEKSFSGELGRLLAVARGDCAIDVYDANLGKAPKKCRMTGHTASVAHVLFAKFTGMSKLLVSGSNDASVKIWDWTASEDNFLKHSIEHGHKVNWLASTSASSENLVVADTSKRLAVYTEVDG